MRLVQRLWGDETGYVISSELVLIGTIVVIGMIVGLVTLRDQIVTELADLAAAVSEFDQSFSFGALTNNVSTVNGSSFTDLADFCDTAGSQTSDGEFSACIFVGGEPVEEL